MSKTLKQSLKLLTLAAVLAGLCAVPLPPPAGAATAVTPDGWGKLSPLYNGFKDISGTSDSDIFAVGGLGGVAHYNGSDWSPMDPGAGRACDFSAVWCNSPSDVFAVGTDGWIMHYDGSSWIHMDSGTGIDLHDVWGSAPDDVFALGMYRTTPIYDPGEPTFLRGVVLQYDGSSWSQMVESGSIRNAIWGSSSADVFAVGEGGAISHYDGASWSAMASGTTNNLNGVWGSSGSDVFAVGDNGTILHYDGSLWNIMLSGTANDLDCIGGVSPSSVFAGGAEGSSLYYDGNTWLAPDGGPHADAIWGSPAPHFFAVSGDSIWHHDGTAWREMLCDTHLHLEDVWGNSASDMFAVGYGTDEGVILHYDGKYWTQANNSTVPYQGIWGSSPIDVFVVGGDYDRDGVVWHYDGTGWSQMSCPATGHGFMEVWGTSSSDVFAVGRGGTVVHYDGSSWSTMSSGTTNDLLGVSGSSGSNVFAVGDAGTIIQYDGTRWTVMASPTTVAMLDVWCASANEAFAIGGSGTILHYDGTAWSPMTSGLTASDQLNGVWGSSASDVFAVGIFGKIVHYNGQAWTRLFSGLPNATSTDGLGAVFGTSSDDIFAVGGNGAVLHYPEMPPAPTIASISPAQAAQGQTLDIVVSGDFGHLPTLDLGDGIAVSSLRVVTLEYMSGPVARIEASISIPADAATGARDVSIVTAGGIGTLAGGFTVMPAESITPYGWQVMTTGKWQNFLRAVWGSSASDVFAVGVDDKYYPIILHFDGTAWTTMNIPPFNPPWTPQAVWGSGPSDVFVAGSYGTIMHYDGREWTGMDSGTSYGLHDLWGSSSSDVFALSGRHIWHYDGNAWSPVDSMRSDGINFVWVISPSDILGVSSGCDIMHYDGTKWSVMSTADALGISCYEHRLMDIWGTSAPDVFAVGYGVPMVHFDGTAWSQAAGDPFTSLSAVWGSAPNDVFAVGTWGRILHYDGQSWTPMDSGTTADLGAVWGHGQTVFAVGSDGTILRYRYPPPIPASLSRAEGKTGETMVLTIAGSNFDRTSDVTFGDGISVGTIVVDNSTQITCGITIAADAAPGARDVSMTGPGGAGTLPAAFEVVAPVSGLPGWAWGVVAFGAAAVVLPPLAYLLGRRQSLRTR